LQAAAKEKEEEEEEQEKRFRSKKQEVAGGKRGGAGEVFQIKEIFLFERNKINEIPKINGFWSTQRRFPSKISEMTARFMLETSWVMQEMIRE